MGKLRNSESELVQIKEENEFNILKIMLKKDMDEKFKKEKQEVQSALANIKDSNSNSAFEAMRKELKKTVENVRNNESDLIEESSIPGEEVAEIDDTSGETKCDQDVQDGKPFKRKLILLASLLQEICISSLKRQSKCERSWNF